MSEMNLRRVSMKIVVSGRVQGVSFRAGLYEKATRLRVDGWVRNLNDGSVEALLQGEDHDVRSVVEWARIGPPRAEVASVSEEPLVPYPKQIGFRIIG